MTNVGNVVITAENVPTNHRKEKEQLFIRFVLLFLKIYRKIKRVTTYAFE